MTLPLPYVRVTTVRTVAYGSLESVVWHEVVHLALSAQAGDRPLPRWFHEGVAMSVDKGLGVTSQVRSICASWASAAMEAYAVTASLSVSRAVCSRRAWPALALHVLG